VFILDHVVIVLICVSVFLLSVPVQLIAWKDASSK